MRLTEARRLFHCSVFMTLGGSKEAVAVEPRVGAEARLVSPPPPRWLVFVAPPSFPLPIVRSIF